MIRPHIFEFGATAYYPNKMIKLKYLAFENVNEKVTQLVVED